MRRPSGRRRCSTWPACHPENRHRAAACRTANSYRGAAVPLKLGALAGGPEQPGRRAADRPARTARPTEQLRTGDQHGGRRNGWHGLGEQHTHPATTPCPRAAVRRPPGWTGRNGSAGSRCPNRTPRPRRSPPGPQPATPSSPAPTRQRDRHRRVAAGESQLFERQRSTHPVLAERGRPVHQHLTGGAVLRAHPPGQPPLHRDPDLRELGQHPVALAPSDRFTSTPLDRNAIGSTVTKRKSVPGYETAARSARNGRRSRGARQRAPVRPAVCSRDPTDRRSASNAPAPITYPTPGHRPGRWTIGRDLLQRARNPR